MESEAGQPARDTPDVTASFASGSFCHEQLARIPQLRHPPLRALQAPRHGDINRGSNGCFGFRTCRVRGCFKCVAHRTDEDLGQRTGRRPSLGGPHAPAAASDLVDHSAGLVVPASVHTATGDDLAKARAVVHAAQLIYTFWNTGDTTFLDQAVSPDFRAN